MIEMMMGVGQKVVYEDFVVAATAIDFDDGSEYGIAYLDGSSGEVLAKHKWSDLTGKTSDLMGNVFLAKDSRFLYFVAPSRKEFYKFDVNTFDLIDTTQYGGSDSYYISSKGICAARNSEGEVVAIFFMTNSPSVPASGGRSALTRLNAASFTIDDLIANAHNQTYPLEDVCASGETLYYAVSSSARIYYADNYGSGTVIRMSESASFSFDFIVAAPGSGIHLITRNMSKVATYTDSFNFLGSITSGNLPRNHVRVSRDYPNRYVSYSGYYAQISYIGGGGGYAAYAPTPLSIESGSSVFNYAIDLYGSDRVCYSTSKNGRVGMAQSSGDVWLVDLSPSGSYSPSAVCT